jgi:tetratricopeptide (TPR) repeat protein
LAIAVGFLTFLFGQEVSGRVERDQNLQGLNFAELSEDIDAAPFWGYLGNYAKAHGDRVKARICYTHAMAGNVPEAYVNYAILDYEEGKYQSAWATLVREINVNPNYSKAWLWLAKLSFVAREDQRAERYLRQALACDRYDQEAAALLTGPK